MKLTKESILKFGHAEKPIHILWENVKAEFVAKERYNPDFEEIFFLSIFLFLFHQKSLSEYAEFDEIKFHNLLDKIVEELEEFGFYPSFNYTLI